MLIGLIYMNGCSACAEIKPHFAEAAEHLRQKYPTAKIGVIDIDKATLPFPVEVFPSLVVRFSKGAYVTNPRDIPDDEGLSASVIERYVAEAEADYATRVPR